MVSIVVWSLLLRFFSIPKLLFAKICVKIIVFFVVGYEFHKLGFFSIPKLLLVIVSIVGFKLSQTKVWL
jgi:hypothetical protein